MADLGSLMFKIGIDLAGFKAGMEQLKAGFSNAGKYVEDNAEKIKRAGLGISAFGVAITGSIAVAVKQTAAFGEQLDKASIRTLVGDYLT